GEDQRERPARRELGGRHAVRDELRVDAALAHAARDELGILAAEVDDENGALLCGRVGKLDDERVGHQRLALRAALATNRAPRVRSGEVRSKAGGGMGWPQRRRAARPRSVI